MRVLREGMTGTDVTAWGNFLLGQSFLKGPLSGTFDQKMLEATKLLQRRSGSAVDGIVGVETYRAGMYLGFDPTVDEDGHEDINWPPPPANLRPVTSIMERQKLFGAFNFTAAPTEHNPEAIHILGDWEAKNIVTVVCPQLQVFYPAGKVRIHRKAADVFLELWRRWETAGLLKHVLVWNGSFVPRYIRGSNTNLSNHSFGSAFDINAVYNRLGARPAARGEKGSVRELVPIANSLGWYWGGHYTHRFDGMHFELVKLP